MQGAAAMAAGVHEEQVARRLHRRDRRADADGRRPARACSPRAASWTPDGDAAFWRAIATTDAFEKRLTLDVALPSGGTVRISAQAKGAGMIQPSFATMLCFVQTDAVAAGRDRRPAARRLRQALLRPHLRRRPALHQRHGDPDGLGRERRHRRPGVRRRARARRGARLRVPPAGAADGPRRRGRGAHRPRARPRRPRHDRRARRPRGRQLAAGQGRAQRRRPELGPHRPGRRRRAAGRRRRCRSTSTSRASRSAPAASRPARRGARSPRRSPATRSTTRSACPARAPRPRSSSPTSRTTTCGSTRSTRRERRPHPARGAPVHPGVPRPDGRHQVRRRGDGRPAAARGLRPRRRAPQVRRDEPDRRPRRRPGHHRATWSG